MSNYAISLKRTSWLLAALTLTALLTLVNFAAFFGKADAAALSDRKVELVSNLAGDNTTGTANTDETNGALTRWTFTFTPTASTIGSVLFKVCTTAVGACTAPTYVSTGEGFDNATLGSTTLAGTWSISNTGLDAVSGDCVGSGGEGLQNCIGITAGATLQTASSKTVVFNSVENPSVNQTYFVRIQTYATNAYGTPVDDGTVAFSITEQIVITARVAESLGFSTTGFIDDNCSDGCGVANPVNVTNCDPVTGSGAIWLGDTTDHTLSVVNPYDNYSFFRIYTNAGVGVSVQYEGPTLTRSAGITITPIAPDPDEGDVDSAPSTEQFGLGIDTTVGANAAFTTASRSGTLDGTYISPAANFSGDPGELVPATGYGAAGGTITVGGTANFQFVADTATEIAANDGYVDCTTAAVRYLANIAPLTEAGTYTTTLVYSAVPTY